MPGSGHAVLVADFDDPDAVWAVVTRHVAAHGPVHVLVNNAGGPRGGPAHRAEDEAFLSVFRQHLLVNHLLVQAVLPGMREAGYGRIINVISTSVKEPIPDLGVSNTIRGAVASWAKTLAGELGAHGITVNNVLPGFTRTARLQSLFAAKAERLASPPPKSKPRLGQPFRWAGLPNPGRNRSSVGDRCMHYCVSLDGHCDCVDAQQEMKSRSRSKN